MIETSRLTGNGSEFVFNDDTVLTNLSDEPKQRNSVTDSSGHIHDDKGLFTALSRMDGAQHGALIVARDLRKEVPHLGKEEFDTHALALAKTGKVSLHRHDYPASMNAEKVKDLIYDPSEHSGGSGKHAKGTYYVGMAIRK